MSEAAPATVARLEDIKNYVPDEYDIIGFGSGIYAGNFNRKLIKYVKETEFKTKNCFVFSTSTSGNADKNNAKFIKLLESKNMHVLGSFACKGLNQWFIFGIGGGKNKGHPDIEDFDAAQNFIEGIINK